MATILVIDDNAEIREVIREILEDEGHQVVEADGGITGLQAFERSGFDLVITDIIMQGKEGLETIQTIRQRSPAQRILAISGGGRAGKDDYLAVAAVMGATATLAKPFKPTALVKAVNEVLR